MDFVVIFGDMESVRFVVFLVLLGVVSYAQEKINRVLEQRGSVYEKYIAHSDTMTVNTWLNIMNSKKLLEQIVHFDSLILDASRQSIQQDTLTHEDVMVSELKQELVQIKDQLFKFKQNVVNTESAKNSYKKYLGVLSVSTFLLFVVVIILAFLSIRLNKSLKISEKESKNYHTDLYAAKHEIEKSIKVENQLATEINRLKQQLTNEVGDLRLEKKQDIEEKLMLDNQIVEVKKAYDLEVSKRMDLENRLLILDELKKESANNTEQNEMIADLQAEIFELTTVNESLMQGLDLAVEKNMAGDQLLVEELDKLKIKYDTEVRTRIQTEEELQKLITNLKSNFNS